MSSTVEQPTTTIAETPTYVLTPEFTSYPAFTQFFTVLFFFFLFMVAYIYAANYSIPYTPNFAMLFDYIIDNPKAQAKFEKYIKNTCNESFEVSPTSSPPSVKSEPYIPLFERIRNYINRIITNVFYVKKNTIHVKV
jgi:hypothetical protein